jgi:hypothetical protein
VAERDAAVAARQRGAYRRGDTAIFVTWDEDDGSHANLVPLLVIAPSVAPGTTVGQRLDHYALLRTTELMLGLQPLGAAGAADHPGAVNTDRLDEAS